MTGDITNDIVAFFLTGLMAAWAAGSARLTNLRREADGRRRAAEMEEQP